MRVIGQTQTHETNETMRGEMSDGQTNMYSEQRNMRPHTGRGWRTVDETRA